MAGQKKRKVRKKFLHRMKIKLTGVFIMVLVGFIVVLCRLVYIEQVKGEDYEVRVLSQQRYDSITIPYRRGDILDRNGTELATSTKVYNLILEPKIILAEGDKEVELENGEKTTKKQLVISALKTYFSLTDEEINQALADENSLYKIMARWLSYDIVAPYNEYLETKDGGQIVGIWLEDEYQRYYPYNTMACQVLGFTASGNVGNSGIELYYNEELNGIEGRQYGYLTSDQTLQRTIREAKNGYSIVTTLDANIQIIVEQQIAEFMAETGAASVSVVAMDPNNGEILAMANSYTFDCNQPYNEECFYYQFANPDGSYSLTRMVQPTAEPPAGENEENTEGEPQPVEPQTVVISAPSGPELAAQMTDEERLNALNKVWRNYVISDSFEPGSTFKPFTVAAGLEEDVIHNSDSFLCEGRYTVIEEERPVNCHLTSGHGMVTIEEAIMQSCNCALMQIVQREGATVFYKYEKVFGFGARTYVDLPGEINTAELFYAEEGLNPMELATASFGQGQNVSMIQLCTGFCSLINGGNYYQPHVMKQVVNENGDVITSYEPTVLRRTISEETSGLLKEYLYQAVETGTGKRVRLEGYSIGGKTGTAEKLPRGNEKYVISFIGFAPVEKPKIVLYVVVDEPREADQSHSGASSLLAHDIFQEVLPYMNVFQSNTSVDDGSPVQDEAAIPVQSDPEPEGEASGDTPEDGTEPENGESPTESSTQEPPQE
ncbi:MAG: penicillin-binding transpeptidase domain-containing protein [Bacteroides sp.]|nr:penicillin-binding transpeptidase domain-containing protein [Bacteroides sp.]MCM1548644.1 penicillin-binding transpeptidase domain-containing protein [Clostridium sp.]